MAPFEKKESRMAVFRNRFNQITEEMFESYCDVTMSHPWKIIIVSLTISILISVLGVFVYKDTFDFDPSKGFETRGTPLSRGRLVLEGLKDYSAGPVDIYKSLVGRKRRAVTTGTTAQTTNKQLPSTLEPITVDYDEYGVDSEVGEGDLEDVCTQYSSMGKHIPYEYMDYLAKIIVEVDNVDEIFTLNTFRALCAVDSIVQSTINDSNYNTASTRLQHSFNLPYMSTCLNLTTRNNCDYLNQPDIDHLRETMQMCEKNGTKHICELNMFPLIKHYLLPENRKQPWIGIVLPIIISDGSKGYSFYSQLLNKLKQHFRSNGMTLRGAHFDIKKARFREALEHDGILAGISAVLVLACFLFYSRDVFFTAIIFSVIFLSMAIAFFIYASIFGISFFPFINLLVLVLMIAIGADDASVLLAYYRIERKLGSGPWKPGDVFVPPSSLHSRSLRLSLRHSLSSMFITSATTAVAFLSNMTSDVIVLRCFGVYASLTVIVNYAMVVLVLPSALMITAAPSTSNKACYHRKLIRGGTVTSTFNDVIHRGRFWIIGLSVFLTTLSVYVVFFSPGLRTPRYNPTKLLIDSDPFEWFDNNAHFFDFEWGRKAKIMEYYVSGDIHIRNSHSMSPYEKGSLSSKTMEVTREDLTRMQTSIEFLMSSNRNTNYTSWLHQFMSANSTCINSSKYIASSCFVEYSVENLPSSFPEDFAVMSSDGPIFDKQLNLIGYFVAIPSKNVLTADADKIQEVFEQIQNNCKEIENEMALSALLCISSADISRYYDVINRLRPSTLSSVSISIAVSLAVVVLCTRRLLLSVVTVAVICAVILWTSATLVIMGWQLSVVESTILVLTIGLSFDYSLHIAAGLKDSATTLKESLLTVFASAGKACVLGSMTSVLCGIPMIFAHTAAFYQVGSMLVFLGILSLLGSCIVLPAFLHVFTRNVNNKICITRF